MHRRLALTCGAYRDRMANRPRKVEPGAIYHFGSRGSDKKEIYLDALDYDIWSRMLGRVARRRGWSVLAWTQMPNHFHVLARVPDMSLSAGMQELNYAFSRRTNARHGRSQHLFANRFWSELIDTQDQLFTAIGYIDVNAYKSKRRVHPRDWRYGSYRALAGYVHAPGFLAVGEILGLFHPDPATAVALYRKLVATAMARVDASRSQASVTEL